MSTGDYFYWSEGDCDGKKFASIFLYSPTHYAAWVRDEASFKYCDDFVAWDQNRFDFGTYITEEGGNNPDSIKFSIDRSFGGNWEGWKGAPTPELDMSSPENEKFKHITCELKSDGAIVGYPFTDYGFMSDKLMFDARSTKPVPRSAPHLSDEEAVVDTKKFAREVLVWLVAGCRAATAVALDLVGADNAETPLNLVDSPDVVTKALFAAVTFRWEIAARFLKMPWAWNTAAMKWLETNDVPDEVSLPVIRKAASSVPKFPESQVARDLLATGMRLSNPAIVETMLRAGVRPDLGKEPDSDPSPSLVGLDWGALNSATKRRNFLATLKVFLNFTKDDKELRDWYRRHLEASAFVWRFIDYGGALPHKVAYERDSTTGEYVVKSTFDAEDNLTQESVDAVKLILHELYEREGKTCDGVLNDPYGHGPLHTLAKLLQYSIVVKNNTPWVTKIALQHLGLTHMSAFDDPGHPRSQFLKLVLELPVGAKAAREYDAYVKSEDGGGGVDEFFGYTSPSRGQPEAKELHEKMTAQMHQMALDAILIKYAASSSQQQQKQ